MIVCRQRESSVSNSPLPRRPVASYLSRWGKNGLDRLWGAYADHEQVEDHRNLCDCARDDDEGMNLLSEVGDQERREQVNDVAAPPR